MRSKSFTTNLGVPCLGIWVHGHMPLCEKFLNVNSVIISLPDLYCKYRYWEVEASVCDISILYPAIRSIPRLHKYTVSFVSKEPHCRRGSGLVLRHGRLPVAVEGVLRVEGVDRRASPSFRGPETGGPLVCLRVDVRSGRSSQAIHR